MKVKYYIKKVDGLVIPTRANESDAGYDIVATSGPKIVGHRMDFTDETISPNTYRSISYIEYETNLYIAPESNMEHEMFGVTFTNFHTDLRPRSSISKYNLVLANSVGLIDRGYRNQILCRFKYIWQPNDFYTYHNALVGTVSMESIYKNGDKIAQLLPMKTLDAEFVVVDELPGIDRGGGFGSTGT